MPNDPALLPDESTGLVDEATLPPATRERLSRAQEDGGFPTTSALFIPFSEPMDESSLEGARLVLDVDAGAEVEVGARYVEEDRALFARPADPKTGFVAGHRFVVALLGGEGGAKTVAGEPLSRPAALAPLFADEEAEDGELEALRLAFQRDLERVAEAGVAREDVALLFSFTTTSQPALWVSPEAGRLPFPSNLRVDEETGRIEVPAVPGEPVELIERAREGLASSDGFSTTGALFLEATGPADRDAALSPSALRLFRTDGGAFEEVSALERSLSADGKTLILRPELTLEHSARYVLVGTKSFVASAGAPFARQDVAALLTLASPLVEEGRSTVLGLSSKEAQRLERCHQEVAPLLDHLEREDGLAREDVVLAVAFDTRTAPELVLAYRAELYTRDVPTSVTDVVEATP